MVISNWVERKLEERRINREQALIKQGFEQGRAYERKLMESEANGDDIDESQPEDEENRR